MVGYEAFASAELQTNVIELDGIHTMGLRVSEVLRQTECGRLVAHTLDINGGQSGVPDHEI